MRRVLIFRSKNAETPKRHAVLSAKVIFWWGLAPGREKLPIGIAGIELEKKTRSGRMIDAEVGSREIIGQLVKSAGRNSWGRHYWKYDGVRNL